MSRAPRRRADVQVFAEIIAIGQLIRSRTERDLPAALSHAQFGVLAHLAQFGPEAGPAELARAFSVTKGAMTNTLQRLEAQGLVSIEGDPADGRRKRVAITEAGLAVQVEALNVTRPITRTLRARFGDDFETVLPLLTALREALEEGR
jgi:DNA-binding MarR family transcriptional regulator